MALLQNLPKLNSCPVRPSRPERLKVYRGPDSRFDNSAVGLGTTCSTMIFIYSHCRILTSLCSSQLYFLIVPVLAELLSISVRLGFPL
jgi:hypothetical protein